MFLEVAFKTGKNTRADLLCMYETESNGNTVSGRQTQTDDSSKANEKLHFTAYCCVLKRLWPAYSTAYM